MDRTRPLRFMSLFSGGGGADLGADLAGLQPVAANEIDPYVAEVFANNLHSAIRVGDLLEQRPSDYPACDFLHASPPCPHFSAAARHARESAQDILLAQRLALFIRKLHPKVVTVENVVAYRRSQSLQEVLRCLDQLDYRWDLRVLNSADFGVPQTRCRLVLRAANHLRSIPSLPAPGPRVGWYSALEDLFPGLPEEPFSPWQQSCLERKLSQLPPRSVLIGGENSSSGTIRFAEEPACTVASARVNASRAFLREAHPEPPLRSWLDYGRVVRLTQRAFARLQTFPDGYHLPEGKGQEQLARRIIGNACPPKMWAVVFDTMKGALYGQR